MSSYLSEAFQKLNVLSEEDFNLNDTKDLEDAKSFMGSFEEVDDVEVIDPETTEENELLDSYIGKVILDCCVCHSKLYKNPEDIILNEDETLANVDEECPYCFSHDGYKVVGQVVPMEEMEVEEEEEIEEKLTEGIFGKKENRYSKNLSNKRDKDELNTLTRIADKVKRGQQLTPDEKTWLSNNHYKVSGKEVVNESRRNKRSLKEENVDLSEYQKWVDFDMERYHEISKDTMKKIKDAGLSVVKDQYGEYEVISDRKDEDWVDASGRVHTDNSWGTSKEWNYNESLKEDDNKVPRYLKGFNTQEEAIRFLKQLQKFKGKDITAKWVPEKDGYLLTSADSPKEIAYVDNIDSIEDMFKKDESLKEDFERVEIETTDQKMEMTSEDNGKVVVTTEPKKEEISVEEEETVEEISDDMKQDIEGRSREKIDAEDEVDVDVAEVDEESINNLGESFLKKLYSNVNSFKTSKVYESKNSLVVEGIINFKSGNNKKTRFVFEAKDISKRGRVRFVGLNEQLSNGKKSFMLMGKMRGNKFIAESMNYNFTMKLNESSQRVSGTVSNKKLAEKKDLSKVKGMTTTKLFADYISKMEGKSKEEILADVEKMFKDNDIDTKKSREILDRIKNAKNDFEAAKKVSDSYLSGANLGVI